MMNLTCGEVQRRLDAYHDSELPVADQIALDAHFEWCDGCAAALSDLRVIRTAVRALSPGRAPLVDDEGATSFRAAVVSQIKAEREASVVARVRLAFDDLHLVYAGLGAAAAAVACVVVMLGMMRFATIARPDSLAAIVDLLASPAGSNENPVALDGRVTLPRVLDSSFSHATRAEEDTVFTLAAVVTREGRITNLALLHANGDDAKLVEGLLNAVSRARFEPATSGDGAPVAVNMIWLVAHTTVRASKHPLDAPATPTVKKRAAHLNNGAVVVA